MTFNKNEFEKKFIENLVPGNYWITKSMDQMKNTYSGTFWYMKKWLTLYNYIFLKEEIFKDDYNKIKGYFDKFVDSLDEKVNDDALEFFTIEGMTELHNFVSKSKSFKDQKEKDEWIKKSKEFYFMYILECGAQNKEESDKKKVKEYLSKDNHTYEELLAYLEDNKDTLNVEEIMSDFSAGNLRNEVLLCKYYGLVQNNKIYNLKDSITEVGQKFIEGNFFESLIIWEHQKLKMISQPPVIDINNVLRLGTFNESNFSLNYNPYAFLIKILDAKEVIKNEDYRYIISRCNKDTEFEDIRNYILDYSKDQITEKLTDFKRQSDVGGEDFNKEIRKYMLGLVNLQKDKETNYYSFIDINGSDQSISGYKISDNKKYTFIKDMYKLIENYKMEKYKKLFERFEAHLKELYINKLELKDYIYNTSYILHKITNTNPNEEIIKLVNTIDDINRNKIPNEVIKLKIDNIENMNIDDIRDNLDKIMNKNIKATGKIETTEYIAQYIYILLHAKYKYTDNITKDTIDNDLYEININHNDKEINLYTQILEGIINNNELNIEEIKEEILLTQEILIKKHGNSASIDVEMNNIVKAILLSTIKNDNNIEKNNNIESEWYEYISQFDDNIFINLIYISICAKYQKYDFKLTAKEIEEGIKDFKSFNKYFDITLGDTIKKLQKHYKDNSSSLYVVNENIDIIKKNIDKISEDDIKEISLRFAKNSKLKDDQKRSRSNIIDYVRKFYISNYKDESEKYDNLIKCDCCGKKTFLSKSNNESFLEFHHIIPFNEKDANGPDHYLNLVGLCPNCHEKIHHIKVEELEKLHRDIDTNNNLGKEIFERVAELIEISRDNEIKPELVTPEGLRYLRSVKAITKDQYRELMKLR